MSSSDTGTYVFLQSRGTIGVLVVAFPPGAPAKLTGLAVRLAGFTCAGGIRVACELYTLTLMITREKKRMVDVYVLFKSKKRWEGLSKSSQFE